MIKKSSTPEISSGGDLTPGEVAVSHLESLSLGKGGYKTADVALELLIAQARTSDCPTCGAHRFKKHGIVEGPEGRKFRIVDKFANRNAVPVGQNARRFELEELQ